MIKPDDSSQVIGGLVSVIMPAYNASRYLEQAVSSVFSQTYGNWELLLINDASKDDTKQIAERLRARDRRVRYFELDSNRGVSAARNRALDEARGQFIAFLDSDDLWVAEKLEKQLAFMEEQEVAICYSWYQRIDEHNKKIGEVHPPNVIDYRQLLKSNFIGNLTGIYDASILGKQRFSNFRHEDYVAWLALLERAGSARGIDEVLASYRVYTGSTSSNKLKAAVWQWRIYREARSLGWFQCTWLMMFYVYYALQKRF